MEVDPVYESTTERLASGSGLVNADAETSGEQQPTYQPPTKNGVESKYFLPHDDVEQDRLDFQHAGLTVLLDGRMHVAPLPAEPKLVLDIATGTGIWALEFGERYIYSAWPNPPNPTRQSDQSWCSHSASRVPSHRHRSGKDAAD
jgi:hypothetical protein